MHRTTIRKTSLRVAALLVLATAAFGLPSVAGAQQARPLKLAIGYIPHIQFAPLYVGIERGFYREAGIDLQVEYGFGIDIFSLLQAGRIDLGLSDSDQLIIAGARGMPLAAVLQYYQKYPVSIVALEKEVTRPEQFVGKTVGTPELYGTSYIGLRLFLEQFGLSDRVKIERIGYTQIPSLMTGKIAGASVFVNNEPLQLRQMGAEISEWRVSDFSEMVGASFISSTGTIDRKRELLARFVEATSRAIEWTVEHPKEAVELSLPYLDDQSRSRAAFLTEILQATNRLFVTDGAYGSLDRETYRESIRILADLGLIDRVYPADRILAPLR